MDRMIYVLFIFRAMANARIGQIIAKGRRNDMRVSVEKAINDIRFWFRYLTKHIDEILPGMPQSSIRDNKQDVVLILAMLFRALMCDEQIKRKILNDRALFIVAIALWFTQDGDNFCVAKDLCSDTPSTLTSTVLLSFQEHHKNSNLFAGIMDDMFKSADDIDAVVERVLRSVRTTCKEPHQYTPFDSLNSAKVFAELSKQKRISQSLDKRRTGKVLGSALLSYSKVMNPDDPTKIAGMELASLRTSLLHTLVQILSFFSAGNNDNMLTRLCDGFRSGLLDALAQITIETMKWDTLQILGDDVLPNAILRIGQLAIAFAAYPKATKSLVDAMDGIHGRLPVLTKSEPFGELWQTLYDTVIDRAAFREMYETARKLENRSCDQVGARSNALLTISLKRFLTF